MDNRPLRRKVLRAACIGIVTWIVGRYFLRPMIIDGDVAHATADMLVSGTGIDAFMSGRDTREVDAQLKKSPDDGKWRFSSVSINAIVER